SSVFRGGIGLESIDAVCATALDLGVPVLDVLQELVDQSLLRLAVPAAPAPATAQATAFATVPAPRYVMLETVREFAAERLSTVPAAADICAAHASRFWQLAKQLARPPLWPARERARPVRTRTRQLPGGA